MGWHGDNVYVLYTADPARLREFLEGFGLRFVPEQHGSGPVHLACQVGERVLEIYLRESREDDRCKACGSLIGGCPPECDGVPKHGN